MGHIHRPVLNLSWERLCNVVKVMQLIRDRAKFKTQIGLLSKSKFFFLYHVAYKWADLLFYTMLSKIQFLWRSSKLLYTAMWNCVWCSEPQYSAIWCSERGRVKWWPVRSRKRKCPKARRRHIPPGESGGLASHWSPAINLLSDLGHIPTLLWPLCSHL